MKLTNLPKEGDRILIFMLIIAAIYLLTGCGSLTTLDSCENKVGFEKTQCIEGVKAKQDVFNRREVMFDRR